jgi:hypothetical protein
METVLPSQLLADIKQSYDFPNRKNIRFEWNLSEALPPMKAGLSFPPSRSSKTRLVATGGLEIVEQLSVLQSDAYLPSHR